MRKLTAKQKVYLNSVVDQYGNGGVLKVQHEKVLEGMNWYETMWSDAQRYLHDLVLELKYRG